MLKPVRDPYTEKHKSYKSVSLLGLSLPSTIFLQLKRHRAEDI